MESYSSFITIFKEFFQRHKKYVFVRGSISALNVPLEIVGISFVISKIFDELRRNKPENLLKWIIVAAILIIINDASYTIMDKMDATTFPEFDIFLRKKISNKILEKNEIDFETLETGQIISNLSKLPNHCITFLEQINFYLYSFLLSFTGFIIFMYFIDPYLGIGSTILGIIYIWIFKSNFSKTMEIVMQREHAENELMDQMNDIFTNSLYIYSNGQINQEKDRLNQIQDDFLQLLLQASDTQITFKRKVGYFNTFFFMGIFSMAFYLFRKGRLTMNATIMVGTATFLLIRYMRTVGRGIVSLIGYSGVSKNLEKFFDKNELFYKQGVKKSGITEFNIKCTDLEFSYPSSEKIVLKNMNFEIKPNEQTAVLGTSGSGKSTLLKLLLGFYEPTKGTLLIDGTPIQLFNKNYLRSFINYIPQNPTLFNRTLYENITYGTEHSKEEVIKSLDELNIHFDFLENGLDTSLGKNGDRLSGGQKQIVLLLRNYFKYSKVLILDEPFSGLDYINKEIFTRLLSLLGKDRTIIIITHDMELAHKIPKQIIL